MMTNSSKFVDVNNLSDDEACRLLLAGLHGKQRSAEMMANLDREEDFDVEITPEIDASFAEFTKKISPQPNSGVPKAVRSKVSGGRHVSRPGRSKVLYACVALFYGIVVMGAWWETRAAASLKAGREIASSEKPKVEGELSVLKAKFPSKQWPTLVANIQAIFSRQASKREGEPFPVATTVGYVNSQSEAGSDIFFGAGILNEDKFMLPALKEFQDFWFASKRAALRVEFDEKTAPVLQKEGITDVDAVFDKEFNEIISRTSAIEISMDYIKWIECQHQRRHPASQANSPSRANIDALPQCG